MIVTEVSDKNKHPKKYKLTLFGIFYAIHIFSDLSPRYGKTIPCNEYVSKDQKSILYQIAETYKNEIPLIFGKWDFLKRNMKSCVEILIDFAHSASPVSKNDVWPPFNARPVSMNGWNSKQGVDADEITLWFYYKLHSIFGIDIWQKVFAKEKEILDLYSKYVKFLSRAQKEQQKTLQLHKFIYEGKKNEAKKTLKWFESLYGISLSHLYPKVSS